MDIGFLLNYQYVTLIDVNPGGEPDWTWVGPGIENISAEKSETTNEKYYYDGGGNASKSITGISKEYAVEGDRLVGDKFQDWAASREECTGSELETRMRRIGPTGLVIERDVTVHETVASDPTGAANENAKFSTKFACNGNPRTIDEGGAAKLPDSLEVADVEVGVNETAEAKPTVSPADASSWCLFAIDPAGRDIASVDSDGVVTGIKAGTTLMTVKCAAKPSVSKQVKVTVAGAPGAGGTTPAKAAAKS